MSAGFVFLRAIGLGSLLVSRMCGRKMTSNRASSVAPPTRRQMIASFALAIGSIASGSDALANPSPPMPEQHGVLGKSPCAIHQEIRLDASPRRIYETLLDSKQFAAFSGF